MSANQEYFTRLINLYSNHYLEYKIYWDLKHAFSGEIKNGIHNLDSPIPLNNGISPVILLGMHRSGTTLVSRMLRESGVYMGGLRGKDTDESLFFQNVNKAIFKLSGAYWDNPVPFKLSLQSEQYKQDLTKILSQYCISPQKTKTYLCASYFRSSTLFSMPQLWGWKDPRTCFSLPIWLTLFPKARIIYIQRNGVDVAQSLVVRNEKFRGRKYFSHKVADLSGAFNLWGEYNSQCQKEITFLPSGQVHIIKYEDLLVDSEKTLKSLFEFLEHKKPQISINALIKGIDGRKAYAFTKNPALVDFYNKVKGTGLMTEMSYDNIL